MFVEAEVQDFKADEEARQEEIAQIEEVREAAIEEGTWTHEDEKVYE